MLGPFATTSRLTPINQMSLAVLADHKSASKKFNGNNTATSCTNLVNNCTIISEFTLLKRAIFATIRPSNTCFSEVNGPIYTKISGLIDG